MRGKRSELPDKPTTVLGRLRRDVCCNTLMIVAFAMMPLIAMVGSGLDMARAYVARDRLQQACDARSLAARRLLSGATLTPAAETEATKYFNFNFP
ncbi:TadE/TadG family type IV pilus assembly protein [Sphingomonas faeni]|uniref:TadE/TadG family type IV pilus assembly protein n=1 Tax=Sphingomonas faeni TaxID=185950 RepID=UPI00277F9275|nr:Tad domain-containing protein [Sphingomonas faeni]MDQ0837174.1 Flp pilus assembly protein TadG [Sphingomonas faeni]